MRGRARTPFGIACALTVATLWTCAPAIGAVTYVPLPSTLQQPGAIEVNSAGELVVLDQGTDQVHVLTPGGAVIRVFSPDPAREFEAPGDLAVGDGDSIYVVRSDRVQRYSSTGAFERALGSPEEDDPAHLARPRGVAVLADGGVYVLDHPPGGGASSVVRFGPDGAYLGRWDVRDSSGTAVEAAAIAARRETVAVMRVPSDAGPGEVIRYDSAGAELNRWPLPPSPAAEWGYPNPVRALWLGDGGGVFTAGGAVVRQFDAAGVQRALYDDGVLRPEAREMFGSCAPGAPVRPPWGASQPASLAGIARDVRGVVYATDSGYGRLVKFDARPAVAVDWAPQGTWGGQVNPRTGQRIVFDASRSSLPLGWLAKFEWDLDGDGTFELDTGRGWEASVHYATAGTREVGVRVTGSTGVATTETVPVAVSDSVAHLFAPRLGLTGQPVRWGAERSYVPCGTIEKYEWDLDGDGSFELDTGTDGFATATYAEPGSVLAHVRVTRTGGRVDTASDVVRILPSPPPGQVGVTINNGATYTNEAVVEVNAVWPPYTKRIVVANDGGFRPSRTFAVAPVLHWRLESRGSERLPRSVYVRFDKSTLTYTDDIILDERSPVLAQVRAVARAQGVVLRVKARDAVSGVSHMQVAASRRKPGQWTALRRRSRLRAGVDAVWVRVRDRAGNASRWKLAENSSAGILPAF